MKWICTVCTGASVPQTKPCVLEIYEENPCCEPRLCPVDISLPIAQWEKLKEDDK